MLRGVGAGPDVEIEIRGKLHLRRSLSKEEMATISAEWMAIPAVHGFSEEDMKAYRPRESTEPRPESPAKQ